MSCMSCMTCMRQAKKVVDDAEKAPVDHSCSHWINCDRQAAFFSIVIRFFNSDFDVFCLSCLPAMMSCATAHHYCAFRCCAGRGRGGRAESSSAASVATENATMRLRTWLWYADEECSVAATPRLLHTLGGSIKGEKSCNKSPPPPNVSISQRAWLPKKHRFSMFLRQPVHHWPPNP